MSDHGPTAQLVGEVWCLTCEHSHIGTIPVTTFKCDVCGFGSWGETVAVAHAVTFPDHIVHPVVHRVSAPREARTIPARSTDPATSHAATAAVTVRAGTQRHRLLQAFALDVAADGLTDEEAADLADGVPYRSEYAKRCSELREAALIEATGAKRPGAAGLERIVSRITDAGRVTLEHLPKPDPTR